MTGVLRTEMYFEGLQLTDRGNWLPADETDDLTARKANGATASLINAILRLRYNRRAPETETFRIFAASLTVRSSDSTDLSSVDWSIDRRFCQRIVFKLLLLASLFGLAISFNISSKAFAQSSPSGNCGMQLGLPVIVCSPSTHRPGSAIVPATSTEMCGESPVPPAALILFKARTTDGQRRHQCRLAVGPLLLVLPMTYRFATASFARPPMTILPASLRLVP
jgi:hypothetical protein